MEPWTKLSFCTKGYAEIHIQSLFFDIEKRHVENS
jgi:hypothetical protein